MFNIQEFKNRVLFWLANMFAAITGVLLVFFATMGVIANFNLPQKIYLLQRIPIPLDVVICIIFIFALYISVHIVQSEAKTDLFMEILDYQGKEQQKK